MGGVALLVGLADLGLAATRVLMAWAVGVVTFWRLTDVRKTACLISKGSKRTCASMGNGSSHCALGTCLSSHRIIAGTGAGIRRA